MAKWMVTAAMCCARLIDLLREDIRSGPLINIDESPFQVLNEAGRRNTSKSYIWVYRGGQPDRPVFLYQYHRTRSGRSALEFLDDYHGYIQSDDFAGYDHLDQNPNIVHLGCWAHARRKVCQGRQVRKKNRSKREDPKSLADEALDYIGKLYQFEKEARRMNWTLSNPQLRQEKAKPILDEFKDWLECQTVADTAQRFIGSGDQLHAGQLGKTDHLHRRRTTKAGQQPGRKCHPPLCRWPKELAVCRQPGGCRSQRHFFHLDRDCQGQRPGAIWLPAANF